MRSRLVVLTLAILLTRTGPALAQTVSAQPTGSADYDETVRRYLNNEEPKIVGGIKAQPGAYPWQVSLLVSNIGQTVRAHFCGGSIYNASWIITAAHCMDRLTPALFQVAAGTNSLNSSVKRISVARRIVHGGWGDKPYDNDVALVQLHEPLQLSEKIKPIEVLDPTDEPQVLVSGQQFVVTGWGTTNENGEAVRDLREVSVPFVTYKACSDPLSYGNQITNNMICAGVAAGGKDACQGDSGGPLVRPKPSPLLVGVVSWGEGCAQPGKYGVYTRISKYKAWVESCTTGGPCPERR